MTFQFPPTPTLNQVIFNGNASFEWDGVKWVNARAFSSFVFPEAPPDGRLYARDGLAQDWEPTDEITDGGTF